MRHLPLISLITCCIALAALFTVNAQGWRGWAMSNCWPDHCFCEAPRPGAIAQPANTFSNLAYILIGGLILFSSSSPHLFSSALHPPSRPFLNHPLYATLHALATAAIGLGSFWFHGSLTYWGNWGDWVGMYAFISFVLVYNLHRLRPFAPKRFLAIYLALNGLLALIALIPEGVKRPVFTALIVLALGIDLLVHLRKKPNLQLRWLWLTLACFALAYFVWNLDNSGVWCWPDSLLQGHAVWHLLTAASAGLMFVYYRSENAKVVGN